MATMKNNGHGWQSYVNKCATNYSIITNNIWNNAYNKQLTKHDTNDDVDTLHLHFNGRVAYMHWDCTHLCSTAYDDTAHLMAQVLSAFTIIFIPSMAHSPWFASPFSSIFSSCLSPSSSSTSSCSLSSTTQRWQTCAAPLQKRVRTPWTPSPLTQVMSPTSWPSGELNDSSAPFSFMIFSTDQDVDDVTLSEMLSTAHRGQVDYCVPRGLSISQSGRRL